MLVNAPTADRPTKRIKATIATVDAGIDASATYAVVSSAETSRVSSPSTETDDGAAIVDDAPLNATVATGVATIHNQKQKILIQTCLGLLTSALPQTLVSFQSKSKDLSTFKELWTAHGFRTSMVTSPKPAVSVYLESCINPSGIDVSKSSDVIEGRNYLLYLLGMHPNQKDESDVEETYQSGIKSVYCLLQFCKKLRSVRESDMQDPRIVEILKDWETGLSTCTNAVASPSFIDGNKADADIHVTNLRTFASNVPEILSNLISTLMTIDHSLHKEQLIHEYDRIEYRNCTLANACLQRVMSCVNDVDPSSLGNAAATASNSKKNRGEWIFQQVYFKASPPGKYLPKYERITIHLNDPSSEGEEGVLASGQFIFLPSLTQVLRGAEMMSTSTSREITTSSSTSKKLINAGVRSVVGKMVQTTWDTLLRHGYYVDEERKKHLGPLLEEFYESGLLGGRDASMPILLNAHFNPTYALSLYLHGTAGAGKSSLVRNIFPAINASIAAYADPELLVRFVKQNLNKPFQTLRLELDLRPNNNDYSVMSIIQGRRMTLTQSKPGLVLVALEEMPSDVTGADPNQSEVAKLLSMRFSGRKGEFKDGAAPRNSEKRGISGDATIITVFTSNYDLEPHCLEALQSLDMFKNLSVIKVAPVAGEDREAFALSYLKQRLHESLTPWRGNININLEVPCGNGDIRPLVRYLRLLSFYIHAMVLEQAASGSTSLDVYVKFDHATEVTTVTNMTNGKSTQLKPGSFQNLYPVKPLSLDFRASNTVIQLQNLHPNLQNPLELSQILEFYFSKTLAPAVILSQNEDLLHDLTTFLAQSKGVDGILDINPSSYKMMKSLYDPTDTPNLRDDILQILHGDGPTSKNSRFVAIELKCNSVDAQLQIREIIEDTPSMTAFSTEKSALYKDGLIFCVYIKGELTPEIESRASLII